MLNCLHAFGILIRKPLNVMFSVITVSLVDTFSLIKDRKWENIFLSNLNRGLFYEYIWKAMPKHLIWKGK